MVRKLEEYIQNEDNTIIQESTQEYDILEFIMENKIHCTKMVFGVVLFGSIGLILLRIFVTLIVELCGL